MADPFIGEIRIFALDFAPRDWAFCDGRLLPIAQNTALFATIGTTYGGDGQSTLGLPNLQGRAPMHAGIGTGPGLSNRRPGQIGGVETVTLTEAQMANHAHVLAGDAGEADEEGTTNPAGNRTATLDASDAPYQAAANLAPMASGALVNAGGGQPHSNLQPYLSLNFCIALQGVFPSPS